MSLTTLHLNKKFVLPPLSQWATPRLGTNLHELLPVIVNMVETGPKKRLLALHAAKEVTFFLNQEFSSYMLTNGG